MGEAKTMRFKDDVERYINAQKGDNFTEKFHNLVRRFKDEEVQKEKTLALLDKQIKEKEQRIRELNNFLSDVNWLERTFKDLNDSIKRTRGYFDNFLEKDIKRHLESKSLDTGRDVIGNALKKIV